MAAAELADWVEFYKSEPWGGDGLDQRIAYAVCRLVRAWGVDVTPEQCRPKWRDADGERGPVMVDFETGIKLLAGSLRK